MIVLPVLSLLASRLTPRFRASNVASLVGTGELFTSRGLAEGLEFLVLAGGFDFFGFDVVLGL